MAALLILLLSACREERGSMVEVSRGTPKRQQPLCEGHPAETARCPQFREGQFPPRLPSIRVVQRVEPAYPAAARRHRLGGTVLVQVGVRRDGSVGGVCVLKPLPCGLSDAAAKAVMQWRFAPQDDDVVTTVAVHFPPPSQSF